MLAWFTKRPIELNSYLLVDFFLFPFCAYGRYDLFWMLN